MYGVRSTIPFTIDNHLTCNGPKFEKKLTKRFRSSNAKSEINGKSMAEGSLEHELPKPFHKRLIISPDARWKSVFDIWVLLFVGYSCIWNILVFAFSFTPNKNLDVFNLIIEFVFQLDFVLTFFQAFKHPETYEVIDDYKLIAINYFWGWFTIDLISVFPFTLFLNSGAQDSAQTVKLARLFRMPRLGKLIDIDKIKKLLKSFQGETGDDKKIVK